MASTSVVVSFLLVKRSYDTSLKQVEDTLEDQTLVRLAQLENYLSELQNDVSLLSSMTEQAVNAPSAAELEQSPPEILAHIYNSVLSVRPHYFQVRFISSAASGQEIVRLVRSPSGSIDQTPEIDLQSKSDEPYFATGISLSRDEIEFSDITLNRENGELDPAMRPTLRVMSPVFSSTSARLGFVIINVDYRLLLERLLTELPPSQDGYIVDPDGNYLSFRADGSISPLVFHTLRSGTIPETVRKVLNDEIAGHGLVTTEEEISFFAERYPPAGDDIRIGLILTVDRKQALAPVTGAVLQASALSIAFTVLSLFASWLLAIRLTQPITEMTGKLRLGQWRALSSAPFSERKDEVGELSRAFSDLFERVTEAESRSRAVLETIAEGVITITSDKQIRSANPAAEITFGYDPEPLTGKTIDQLFPDFDWGIAQLDLSAFTKKVEGKSSEDWLELGGLKPDGSRFSAEVSIRQIERDGGQTFVCAIRDISDRKRAELNLAEERNFLTLVLDSNPTYIFIKDENGNIIRSNKAFQNLFEGADVRPLTARASTSDHAPSNIRRLEKSDREAFKRGYSQEQNTLEFTNGTKRVLTTEKVRFQLSDGGPALLCVSQDITEREELLRDLSRSNKDLDDFAYIASHDLQAPLRVIENATNWLEEDLGDQLDSESRENLGLIRSRVTRLGNLLKDLLAFSRVGKEHASGANPVVSGNDLIEDVRLLLNIPQTFQLNVAPDMADVRVHSLPLLHIFANLVDNAIKHHDKGAGIVSIDVEVMDGFYRFSVSDDGPGINAEYHTRIFELFQTLRPRDDVEGSGMGLALVKKHLDMRNCTIEIVSEPAQGACFRFTWPMSNEAKFKT